MVFAIFIPDNLSVFIFSLKLKKGAFLFAFSISILDCSFQRKTMLMGCLRGVETRNAADRSSIGGATSVAACFYYYFYYYY